MLGFEIPGSRMTSTTMSGSNMHHLITVFDFIISDTNCNILRRCYSYFTSYQSLRNIWLSCIAKYSLAGPRDSGRDANDAFSIKFCHSEDTL